MRLSQSKSRKLAGAIIGGFFAIGLSFLLARPTNKSGQSGQPTPTQNTLPEDVTQSAQPGAVIQGFHRIETKNGKTLWEISADRGEYLASSGGIKLFAPSLSLFRRDEPILVSAGEAVVHIEGAGLRSAELSQGVKIVVDSSTSITTDLASYDRPSDSIASPGGVKIKGAMIEVSGGSLSGSILKDEFTIAGGVESVINPLKRQP